MTALSGLAFGRLRLALAQFLTRLLESPAHLIEIQMPELLFPGKRLREQIAQEVVNSVSGLRLFGFPFSILLPHLEARSEILHQISLGLISQASTSGNGSFRSQLIFAEAPRK